MIGRAWESLDELLAARCEKSGDHLLWKGFCGIGGPTTMAALLSHKRKTPVRIRRLVLEAGGAPKDGRDAVSVCGIASCLAFAHLAWGSHQSAAYGILTAEAITEIGAAYERRKALLIEANGLTDAVLSRKYGVTRERIRQVLRDKFGVRPGEGQLRWMGARTREDAKR